MEQTQEKSEQQALPQTSSEREELEQGWEETPEPPSTLLPPEEPPDPEPQKRFSAGAFVEGTFFTGSDDKDDPEDYAFGIGAGLGLFSNLLLVDPISIELRSVLRGALIFEGEAATTLGAWENAALVMMAFEGEEGLSLAGLGFSADHGRFLRIEGEEVLDDTGTFLGIEAVVRQLPDRDSHRWIGGFAHLTIVTNRKRTYPVLTFGFSWGFGT